MLQPITFDNRPHNRTAKKHCACGALKSSHQLPDGQCDSCGGR